MGSRPVRHGQPPRSLTMLMLLLKGADISGTGIGRDHATLLAITGQKDVPVRRTTELTS